MKVTRIISFVCIVLLFACNETQKESLKKEEGNPVDSVSEEENCAPIMDPNEVKPMALMMRVMAANADSMRSQLLRGEKLDSIRYPFLRFYLVEPTKPEVLEPQFYENARLFQSAYKQVFRVKKEEQIAAYNVAIGKCITCHESYCSGPLKRIRKFPIPSN